MQRRSDLYTGEELHVFGSEFPRREAGARSFAVEVERSVMPFDLFFSLSDGKGVVYDVNASLCEATGFEKEELVGVSYPTLCHPGLPRSVLDFALQKVWRGERVTFYEKILCRDGAFFWTLSTLEPAEEKGVKGFTSVRSPVSERAKRSVALLYEKINEAEGYGGQWSGHALFDDFLRTNGIETTKAFNHYMESLNH